MQGCSSSFFIWCKYGAHFFGPNHERVARLFFMSELLSTFLEYMILVCWSLPRSVLFCIKDKDKDKDKDNDQHIDKDMRVQEPGVVPCQGQVCFAPAKSPGRSWWGPNGRPQARPSPMGGRDKRPALPGHCTKARKRPVPWTSSSWRLETWRLATQAGISFFVPRWWYSPWQLTKSKQ